MKYLLIFLLGAAAQAQPVLYNSCKNVRIQAVKGGAGVYLNEDCSTAYVLPPIVGSFTITNMTVSENLRLCPSVSAHLNIMADQAGRLEKLSKKVSGVDESSSGSVLFPGKPKDSSGSVRELEEQVKEVRDLYVEINKTMEDYRNLEGSVAQAVLNAEHQALVEAYQKKNPNLKFEAIPLAKAELNFVRRVTDNTSSLPALLAFDVAGKPVEGSKTAVVFGGAVAGQLVLSLIGACPYYDVGRQRMKVERLEGKSLAPNFVAGVNYEYNLKANKAYTAKYNLASFFRRLQTSESKGGFFSSKTVSRLIIEKDSKDWFEFVSHSDDPRHEFEDGLRATVKADLVDRAFRQIASLTVGPGEQAPALISPKANGAQVGAENLRKCPYVYCQVGAALLDVGNAIFGSAESVSDFIQRNNFWATDDVKESKMLPFQGTTWFSEKGGA